jgi:hypothetical protein
MIAAWRSCNGWSENNLKKMARPRVRQGPFGGTSAPGAD